MSKRILALGLLLFGMIAVSNAQVLQVFSKDGTTTKFEASEVDSLLHNGAEGVTTLYFSSGEKETFLSEETDSLVLYDDSSSILSKLRSKGNYTYFLRLVQEDDYWTDQMNGATDLTVFAANDDNWRRFFEKNANRLSPDPWRTATSYEALTADQKRALLLSAVANANAGSDDAIRTKSEAAGLEALQHLSGSEVPFNYCTTEKWYWERFHESKGGNGIWLAVDSCFRYTSFFTPEKIKKLGITEQDYAILFPGAANRIANGIDIVEQETATNGTIQSVAAPLTPLQSMADVIRTNGKTNIFSHLLDRYSAPFYSPVLTEAYKTMHPEFTDSIFIKRYFSNNNYSVKAGYARYDMDLGANYLFEPGPDGTYQKYNPYLPDINRLYIGSTPSLKFDPGWAGYYEDWAPEKDMAAMFVPSDDALWRYFTEGAGQSFIEYYYAKKGTADEIPYTKPTTQEELFQQIDCIPVGTLVALVNYGMQRSFFGSVPSKWSKLTDDAMAPLFDNTNEVRTQLNTCLLANNGVVYVMDGVYLPADYSSVTAPAFISNTCKVMKSAIYDNYMNLNYYAYLKAPMQDITFFLPTDEALRYYYDPISMKSRQPRVIEFSYSGGSNPIKLQFYYYYCPYNKNNGEIGTISASPISGANSYDYAEVINRLKDILYSHTIVNDGTQDIHSRNEYYRTLGGDVVKVVRDASGNIIGAKGTFQLENERQGIDTDTPGVTECIVQNSYESLSNGQTYTLNAPLVPTYRSLYSIMTNDANMHSTEEDGFGGETPYSEFYKLCSVDEDAIIGCGIVDGNLSRTQRQTALKRYMTFISDKGLDYNLAYLSGNTPYTVYIPTNEAVRAAIAQGLPTWEDISEDFHSHCKPEIDEETGEPRVGEDGEIIYSDSLQSSEDSIRIAGKINTLVNVIKAHFHYGMAIADQEPFQKEYKSLLIDNQTLASPKVKVNCTGSGNMSVTDWKGHTFDITDNKNVFVRDYRCNSSPVGKQMRGIVMQSYRPGVIHQINGVLGF